MPLRGKRVFLIDDEKPMTELLSVLLGLNGASLASDNDPESGLARLLESDWDAVVVDLMMPELDGLTVVERLRRSARHAKTPIIVLSAKTVTDEERKRLVEHSVRFVAKPVTPSRLISAVRESLSA